MGSWGGGLNWEDIEVKVRDGWVFIVEMGWLDFVFIDVVYIFEGVVKVKSYKEINCNSCVNFVEIRVVKVISL